MAKGCCGGGCSCAFAEGTGVTITGTGTSSDPFTINADINLTPVDNTVFDITLTGDGSPGDPYDIEVDFAATASVKAFPDWSDAAPTNGQVPVWNSTLGQYVPGSNTPAATGAVSHDLSLDGDGSSGDPLQVVHDPDRLTDTFTDGIGLNDDGINQLVRRFPDAATRASAAVAPDLNTFSALDTSPGDIDYWTGSQWLPVEDVPTVVNGEFLNLSGSYANGRVHRLVKQLSLTTDTGGNFVALTSSDLAGLAGVLEVQIQPTGSIGYHLQLSAGAGQVQGTAFRLDTGAAFPSQPITAIVTALVY